MNNRIYQKTLKGSDEITHRSNAISARLRRLLIMIDGRKNNDQLRAMAPVEDLPQALRELESLGLIEVHQTSLADLISSDTRSTVTAKRTAKSLEEEYWGSV
ncbi:MAG: hypothetical protein P4L87_10675 [Formivibrio sp.]|nr:hypothetical protein [Formivibrio sp.]